MATVVCPRCEKENEVAIYEESSERYFKPCVHCEQRMRVISRKGSEQATAYPSEVYETHNS